MVTIFTLGGLLGSLGADVITRYLGRIGALRSSEIIFVLGSVLVGIANIMPVMMAGRCVLCSKFPTRCCSSFGNARFTNLVQQGKSFPEGLAWLTDSDK